jgi:thioredoxin reductase (NADPH)
MESENYYDVIILGGGPAGLSAGIYLSRAKIKTLIINEGIIGGQMILSHEIANYPGVLQTSGYILADTMKKQAESFGCEIISGHSISEINLDNRVKTVKISNEKSFNASSIILAPGGRSKTLGVLNEEKFKGRGISYCATCDGDFFSEKEIVVVGGGNSAVEEAISLTKYASKVTIIHYLNELQAFKKSVDEAKSNEKINFIMNSKIISFIGDEKLDGVEILNTNTKEVLNLKTDGAFIFIGYTPNTEFLKGKVNLNEKGEIITDINMSTNIEGVYAAGDSIQKKFRQITTAVSDGTIAALSVSNFLEKVRPN